MHILKPFYRDFIIFLKFIQVSVFEVDNESEDDLEGIGVEVEVGVTKEEDGRGFDESWSYNLEVISLVWGNMSEHVEETIIRVRQSNNVEFDITLFSSTLFSLKYYQYIL